MRKSKGEVSIQQDLLFEGGYLYLQGLHVLLFPYPSICALFSLCDTDEMKQLRKHFFKESFPEFFYRPQSPLFIKHAVNLFNSFGLGKVTLLSRANNNFVVLFEETLPLHSLEQYPFVKRDHAKKMFKEYVIAFFEEVLTFYFEEAYCFKDEEKEEKRVHSLHFVSTQEHVKRKVISKEKTREKRLQSSLLREVIVKQQLFMKKGFVSLWRTPGVFLPKDFLLFYLYINSKRKEHLATIAYLQGRIACKRQIYFISRQKELFERIVKQCELVGFGPLSYREEGKFIHFSFKQADSSLLAFLEVYALEVFRGISEEFKGKKLLLFSKKRGKHTLSFTFEESGEPLEDDEEVKHLFSQQIH